MDTILGRTLKNLKHLTQEQQKKQHNNYHIPVRTLDHILHCCCWSKAFGTTMRTSSGRAKERQRAKTTLWRTHSCGRRVNEWMKGKEEQGHVLPMYSSERENRGIIFLLRSIVVPQIMLLKVESLVVERSSHTANADAWYKRSELCTLHWTCSLVGSHPLGKYCCHPIGGALLSRKQQHPERTIIIMGA